ncbi:MAG: hypothetical protein EOO46_13425 [Flavobacterium sp.]|nr:MAG: hypothetical protein EOO46_13425 [Flavobacterium sp.]
MKKSHFLLLLISFFLLNCTKKEEVKNEVYIISKEDRDNKKRLEEAKIPPAPKGYYGLTHIIIDEKGDLYFYQRPYRFVWICIDEEDPLPEFIDLNPNDLVKIPNHTVADFLKENTAKRIKEKKGVLVIASQLDTLKTKAFFELMYFIHDYKKSQIALYLIRRTTHEEDVVLKYKKNDLDYYADSIQWDKSRIRFFD